MQVRLLKNVKLDVFYLYESRISCETLMNLFLQVTNKYKICRFIVEIDCFGVTEA